MALQYCNDYVIVIYYLVEKYFVEILSCSFKIMSKVIVCDATAILGWGTNKFNRELGAITI